MTSFLRPCFVVSTLDGELFVFQSKTELAAGITGINDKLDEVLWFKGPAETIQLTDEGMLWDIALKGKIDDKVLADLTRGVL